jgi:hypothetical protein
VEAAVEQTEKATPASDAEVIEAMIREFYGASLGERLTRALAAAQALGVLMPDEAAGLRDEISEARSDKEYFQGLYRSGLDERDALAARVRVLEEGLRKIADSDWGMSSGPDGRSRGTYGHIAHAALSTEARPDAG